MDTLTRKATGVRITWIVVAVVVGLGLAPQLTPAKIVVESSVDTLAAFGTVIHEAQYHAGLTESEKTATRKGTKTTIAERTTVPMVCNDATRKDGTEDPAVRYFACYWAVSPT